MTVPEGQTLATDADDAYHSYHRHAWRFCAWSLGDMTLSVPVSIIMGAVAEVIVALAAVPVAFALTRDGYVASAALSYGPFAAAASLLWLINATALWGLATPFILPIRRQSVALLAGIVAVIGGYGLATYLVPLLPVTRVHTMPLTDLKLVGTLALASGAGGVAGLMSARRAGASPPRHSNDKVAIGRHIKHLALFAVLLALVLQVSIAALAAWNQL